LDLIGESDIERKREIEGMLYDDKINGVCCTLLELLKSNTTTDNPLLGCWSLVEKGVLQDLAKQSWLISKRILEGLYPVPNMGNTQKNQ
jgi:hypothetical protein